MSACRSCRSRVLAGVALVDLLDASAPHPDSAALIALADALCAEDELHGDRIAEIVTATLAA